MAVSWSAVFAGSVVMAGVSLILIPIGAGLGFTAASALHFHDYSAMAGATGAAIWLIVSQWIASGIGGYITGRLRTRWPGVHTHEVFFRDTAHGLLSWCLAAMVWTSLVSGAGSDVADTHLLGSAVLLLGLSMLVGAFIAAVAAVVGGHLRDEHGPATQPPI